MSRALLAMVSMALACVWVWGMHCGVPSDMARNRRVHQKSWAWDCLDKSYGLHSDRCADNGTNDLCGASRCDTNRETLAPLLCKACAPNAVVAAKNTQRPPEEDHEASKPDVQTSVSIFKSATHKTKLGGHLQGLRSKGGEDFKDPPIVWPAGRSVKRIPDARQVDCIRTCQVQNDIWQDFFDAIRHWCMDEEKPQAHDHG